MRWKNVLLGCAVAAFFSVLYLFGVFNKLGEQVYDFFLGLRANRERSGEVVFLDVDDSSVAYNGVFPWPRSIMADGLLRLKEYGVRAAVFDIEYLDKGPQGVDTIYLNQGLPADFDQTFSGISSAASDVFAALKSGRIRGADIDDYAGELSGLIRGEHDNLLTRAQSIARDNDQYLFQASALFGKSWVTLNLRSKALDGEQAQRRAIAEERFSWPVAARENANKGKYIDILPPLPGFASSALGAGFTNVEIDTDGIRRRIDLAQNIHNHWYLQLAFAPLIGYLGKPAIELDNRNLILRNAKLPGGDKDIVIPLDGKGRMLLDWPRSDYIGSYSHVSFSEFSLLEDIEAELEQYARSFGAADISFFSQFDSSLMKLLFISGELERLFDAIQTVRAGALEQCSEEQFAKYVEYRGRSRSLIRELLNDDPSAKVRALGGKLAETYPESAEAIREEAAYIAQAASYLLTDLNRYEEVNAEIESKVKNKFCILGRVDTGTTDIGANPFYGEYVNVGTHGVVLDMILSETFIFPIARPWQILFAMIFMFMFFFGTAGIAPVPRTVAGFVITLFVIAASALLFRYTGYFFNPLLITFSMIGAVILREIIAYAGSEQEKQFIRRAFSTYVSNDIVREIIADPSRLQLGGTKRYMTALFTDVQGFSGISEKLDPENLVTLLNRYLTAMSDVILAEKGTIDKYEGDAIVTFFGAPLDVPDHALRACVTAITMKRIEKELNTAIIAQQLSPVPLLTRIGINTGSMVAGNMGTGSKMNYTIMGNAVNLASRLEGVNKQYGSWILASEQTVRETGGRVLTRKLDRIRVVGINEPVRIHELLNIMEDATAEEKKLVDIFHQSLDCYENRNWKMAMEGFREAMTLEGKGPAAQYLARCEQFIQNPPDESWDGIHNLTEK